MKIAKMEAPVLKLSPRAKMNLATRAARQRIVALKEFYPNGPNFREQDPVFGAKYRGRLTNFLSGFGSLNAGGTAVCNIALNQRIHGIDLQTSCVNYTGGVAIVPTIVTAGGFTNTTGTITLTVTNGVVTGATYSAGNSAGATTATVLSVPDITGATPIIFKCSGAGTGALGSATFTLSPVISTGNYGAAGPCPPATLISSIKISVNGQNLRDISPTQIQSIQAAHGYLPDYGTLSIMFTEPWQNFLRDNQLHSWDLFGQSQCSIQVTINQNITLPGLNGVTHFDGARNTRKATANDVANKRATTVGASIPFLSPKIQHAFQQSIVTGKNDITILPWSFPISALWFLGSSPGNLYQLEILADGNKLLEASAAQIYSALAKYGYLIGNIYGAPSGSGMGFGGVANGSGTNASGNFAATTIPNGALPASGPGSLAQNGVFPWDLAWIFDMDGRPWEALTVEQSLIVRVYSNVNQTLTIVQETLPGGYVS